jgi:hypothetical protein
LYTKNLIYYYSINLLPVKKSFSCSLINYIVTIKTQYSVQVAIIYTDNNLVLININTTKKLASKSTCSKLSMLHAYYKNSIAETSNCLKATGVRAIITTTLYLLKLL